MPESFPQNIDVTRLYDLLRDTKKQEEIGHDVLRAVIIDVLKSKAGGTSHPWILRHMGGASCVIAVLQKLVDDVSLTEEELELLKKLESEKDDDDSVHGG